MKLATREDWTKIAFSIPNIQPKIHPTEIAIEILQTLPKIFPKHLHVTDVLSGSLSFQNHPQDLPRSLPKSYQQIVESCHSEQLANGIPHRPGLLGPRPVFCLLSGRVQADLGELLSGSGSSQKRFQRSLALQANTFKITNKKDERSKPRSTPRSMQI